MPNMFFLYLRWHFIDNSRLILRAWQNCLRFNLNYWSLPLLFRTFFSHWHRYRYSYVRGFDLAKHFETLTFNLLSRIMGAIVRTCFIIIGLFSEIFIFLAGIAIFLFWIFLPLLIIGGIFYGCKLLF